MARQTLGRRSPAALGLVVSALLAASACADQARPEGLAARRAPVTTASTTTSTTAPATTTSTSSAPSTTATTAAPVDLFALRPPAAATDPVALAAQITAAETTIRDPSVEGEALAGAALAQQVAYRQLGSHPDWDAAVLAAVPEGLRRAVDLNAAARREFRAMHTKLGTNVPAWHIVAPAPVDVLMASYEEAQATFGIAWPYLAAINLVETGIGRIRGTSTAGAQGPMQFMPATWAAYGAGGDINDTHDAILGAARYLAANNGAADIDHALYRYNHSQHYVNGVRLYAELIAEHPRAFLGFYHWGVWYVTDQGDIYLPVGYEESVPVPAAEYLAR
jgi:membrane-bound lytic murein transglycosylase B